MAGGTRHALNRGQLYAKVRVSKQADFLMLFTVMYINPLSILFEMATVILPSG